MANRNIRSTPRSGAKPAHAVPVVIVLVILASGIGLVYAYPTIAHYFQPQNGLAATVQITNVDGVIAYTHSAYAPLAVVQLVGTGGSPTEVYDSSTGQSGSIQYNLGATIQIQSGTAANYTINGGFSLLINGKNDCLVHFHSLLRYFQFSSVFA